MAWLMRAPHKLVIDATFRAGDLTKTFHLEFPANTSLDDIEGALVALGIVEPRIEITGTHEMARPQRPR